MGTREFVALVLNAVQHEYNLFLVLQNVIRTVSVGVQFEDLESVMVSAVQVGTKRQPTFAQVTKVFQYCWSNKIMITSYYSTVHMCNSRWLLHGVFVLGCLIPLNSVIIVDNCVKNVCFISTILGTNNLSSDDVTLSSIQTDKVTHFSPATVRWCRCKWKYIDTRISLLFHSKLSYI